MSLSTVPAPELLTRLEQFDSIIDARSPLEFLEDHLPGAVNWPTLDDAQRSSIGTLYQQVNAFEAKKRGAAIAARNIAEHIEREVIDRPKDWKPLLYCWRGGKRSGSLALVLDQIGFRVTLAEGGYKAFRAALVQDIPRLAQALDWRVVCGTTGSGKTRLLQALQAAGAQVLDLEALARHRSSVLGALPGLHQPGQKRFDNLVWQALCRFDPAVPVYVESESRKVGNLAVPESLIAQMRASPCLNLVLGDEQRVALLLEDYEFFVQNTEQFCERLEALSEIRGKAVIQGWQALARGGNIEPVVRDLLTLHYDPVYLQSMQRNFRQFAQARAIAPRSYSAAAFAELAQQLLQESGQPG